MEKKPFELRILGITELTRCGKPVVDGMVRQPKRLALLAYLAITTAKGYRRRDEVIGLFWPELDQTQGRTYLRKALHGLRDELGDEIIVARGDDEVRINDEFLWCDAVALKSLFAAGKHRDALDLYGGDLLPALYPEGVAQAFEEWLRTERKTLQRNAAASAWECVRIAEESGNTGEAATLARRALEVDPDNEEGVRRLIALLDKRGDRAAALRLYKEWEVHLHAEFGVEPAPETRRLARQVRAARRGESHETPPTPFPAVSKSFTTLELATAVSQRRSMITKSSPGWTYVTGALLILVITMATRTYLMRSETTSGARSVAVLPLRTIGGSEAQQTAALIVEELTTRLATDSSLTVRSLAYKSDVDKSRVGVAYLVEGASQRNGDNTRVTIRLLRAEDLVAVWARSYDARSTEGSTVAYRIAQEVWTALTAELDQQLK